MKFFCCVLAWFGLVIFGALFPVHCQGTKKFLSPDRNPPPLPQTSGPDDGHLERPSGAQPLAGGRQQSLHRRETLLAVCPLTGGGELLPGKTPVGKILSQISGQYFSGLFKGWDTIFPANLRIVEFNLHKDSNYRQNSLQKFPALRADLYIFPIPAGRDRIFPGQNKDWDRISPGQNFSQTEFPPPVPIEIHSSTKKKANLIIYFQINC